MATLIQVVLIFGHLSVQAEFSDTGSPIARYTWSLSCLYVAVPNLFLEIVSLGSILVGHRTRELNLTIPNFCCNMSKTEDERKETINDMIENVLAEVCAFFFFFHL